MPAIERPDTGNYFRFYGIEPSFDVDLARLKTLFLQKSREYHPDFYTHDPESQNIALAVSAFNNKAYKILGDDISRAQYLVDLNTDEQERTQQLPQTFLMDMMDLNESIDELSIGNDTGKQELSENIASLKQEIKKDIDLAALANNWQETQMALLKWKYLERLEARLRD